MFEIGKSAAIANAVVSATEAVPHAYKWGTKIGGPVLGSAFAATAIAATAVQIQNLNATSFNSKSVSDSGSTSTSNISTSVPTQEASKAVEIHFNGEVNGIDAEQLANTLKDFMDSTDFIMIEQASRNGQELAA